MDRDKVTMIPHSSHGADGKHARCLNTKLHLPMLVVSIYGGQQGAQQGALQGAQHWLSHPVCLPTLAQSSSFGLALDTPSRTEGPTALADQLSSTGGSKPSSTVGRHTNAGGLVRGHRTKNDSSTGTPKQSA